jgi:hypothetical protein
MSRFLIETEDEPTPRVPRIVGVRPYGSTVLVEMLTAEESLGTHIHVKKDAQVGAPQAYVRDLGPLLDPSLVKLKPGDRVMLQGSYVPVPNFDRSERARGIVELHNIKAVFEEAPAGIDG